MTLRSLLLLALCVPLSAAVDGTIINGTTGKLQPNVPVSLVKPGQGGMRTLGNTTSDAAGKFAFTTDEPGGGPQLLQANYKGVNYNKLLTPNVVTGGVQVDVFESTASPAVARITQRLLVLEPTASQLAASETVVIQNDSKTTYNNDKLGALRFDVPAAANGQVRVSAQGPGGMPLPRAPQKTTEEDIYQVNFPIKPGQSQFEINYVLVAGSPITFHGRLANVKGMEATAPLRLVAPPGVTLSGKDVELIGTEPKTQANIYNVLARDVFTAEITGIGSFHPDENAATPEGEGAQITEGRPPVYAHIPWLLALALGVLGVGLVYLFRTSPVRSPYGN